MIQYQGCNYGAEVTCSLILQKYFNIFIVKCALRRVSVDLLCDVTESHCSTVAAGVCVHRKNAAN